MYSELNLTLNECIQVQGHAITLTITADDDLNQPIRTQLREAQMRPMWTSHKEFCFSLATIFSQSQRYDEEPNIRVKAENRVVVVFFLRILYINAECKRLPVILAHDIWDKVIKWIRRWTIVFEKLKHHRRSISYNRFRAMQ